MFEFAQVNKPCCEYTDTGWRRPIGCLKLQVIFRKRATNYRALLQKMTYKDKASYDSTPPCTGFCYGYTGLFCGYTIQGCFADLRANQHEQIFYFETNLLK